jgi:hypothetical protein
MSGPPIVHFVPEIFEKELGSNKFVRGFFPDFVLVIALACLVVIAKGTNAIHHKRKSILERVVASGNWRW